VVFADFKKAYDAVDHRAIDGTPKIRRVWPYDPTHHRGTVYRGHHFKYLETIISQDLDEGKNLTERVRKAWRRFFGLMLPIRANTGNLLAEKIFQGYALPMLLFGAETWTYRTIASNISRNDSRTLRRVDMEGGFRRAATAPPCREVGPTPPRSSFKVDACS
jgi:hypothetical protein